VALSEFAQEPFVMYTEASVPNLFAVAMLRCQQSGFTPRIAQDAVQVQTIVSLVESGLGVALVPGVARRYSNSGVRFLSLSDSPHLLDIGIALATVPQTSNRLVARFIQHTKAEHDGVIKKATR
jgi:DNA-binding transcriptional LysR family regulator